MASEYLDCEVYLSDESHARLSVAGREHTGRVCLDEALRHRLRKAALDPNDYGTLLFDALFRGAGDDLLAGYHEALTLARRDRRRLRLRLHLAASAPALLHDLDWELLYDSQQRIAFGRSQEMAFSRYLSVP
ncbi:MAG: hypothetical protein GY856_20995, partial [bacterium]|nr:hypothetical protein [bacterium]